MSNIVPNYSKNISKKKHTSKDVPVTIKGKEVTDEEIGKLVRSMFDRLLTSDEKELLKQFICQLEVDK